MRNEILGKVSKFADSGLSYELTEREARKTSRGADSAPPPDSNRVETIAVFTMAYFARNVLKHFKMF